jgi:hypothetical protein
MDIFYDYIVSMRNANRPYTQEELNEIYKKDHSIIEEDKRSPLGRRVSFPCDADTDVNTGKVDDKVCSNKEKNVYSERSSLKNCSQR